MESHLLPVYNKARLLYIQFERSTQKAPLNMKRSKIAEIECAIVELMCDISDANEQERDKRARLEYISRAIKRLHRVKVLVRVLYDLNVITKKGFGAIALAEENVARQLAGWEKSTISSAE